MHARARRFNCHFAPESLLQHRYMHEIKFFHAKRKFYTSVTSS